MSGPPDISPLLPDEATVRARRDALTQDAQARDPRQRYPSRARSRRLVVVLASLLLLSAGAAVADRLLSADDVKLAAGVGCYDRASLDANVTFTRSVADPAAACAALWRRGAVTAHESTEPPRLVACADADQPVRVFPGSSAAVCRDLGLERLPADYPPAGARSAKAYAALEALAAIDTATARCPSARAQAELARARLAAADKAVAVTIAAGGPCAGGYDVVGDGIAVLTVSESEAHANWLDARIGSTLAPLFAGPQADCRSPEDVARAARQRLDDANLGAVSVRVDGAGDCLGAGLTISASREVVTLQTR